MALTELQLPTREVFYAKLQAAATEMNRLMDKWENLSEFLVRVQAADLDSMVPPVASGQVRTDLINFRTAIDEMLSLWNGNDVSPTNTPKDIIVQIRSM